MRNVCTADVNIAREMSRNVSEQKVSLPFIINYIISYPLLKKDFFALQNGSSHLSEILFISRKKQRRFYFSWNVDEWWCFTFIEICLKSRSPFRPLATSTKVSTLLTQNLKKRVNWTQFPSQSRSIRNHCWNEAEKFLSIRRSNAQHKFLFFKINLSRDSSFFWPHRSALNFVRLKPIF